MKLSELKGIRGARKRVKRLGRGNASGHGGGTCTKGHKGQKARSGPSIMPWFEGGQMPIIRRLPKRGFVNISRVEFEIVNIGQLNIFEKNSVVEPSALAEKGLIKDPSRPIKILGRGELNKPLTVKAHKFSKSAEASINRAQGKVEVIK